MYSDATKHRQRKRTMLAAATIISATIIFALTGVPTLIGQVQENSSKPVHYFVRNLGTLGGR